MHFIFELCTGSFIQTDKENYPYGSCLGIHLAEQEILLKTLWDKSFTKTVTIVIKFIPNHKRSQKISNIKMKPVDM